MDKVTLWRAHTIVRRGIIFYCDDSRPNFHHWKVQQRNKEWTDVWLKTDRHGIKIWSCNSLRKKSNGEKWGCVLHAGARDKPFCSHTLAAEIWMEQRMVPQKMVDEYDAITGPVFKGVGDIGELKD